MHEDVRRAIDIVEKGVSEARRASEESGSRGYRLLRGALERALNHLEESEQQHSDDPEDVMSSLDRKSKDIAEDLRRAERLMRERTGGK